MKVERVRPRRIELDVPPALTEHVHGQHEGAGQLRMVRTEKQVHPELGAASR